MQNRPAFKAAFPYQNDVLALPVTDLDSTSATFSVALLFGRSGQ